VVEGLSRDTQKLSDLWRDSNSQEQVREENFGGKSPTNPS